MIVTDELRTLADRIVELKRENDWMVMKLNAEHLVRQNVERENAKLRELVHIAGTYCVNGMCGKDDGCPLYLGKPYCALPDRMRELGVEV